LAGKRDKIYLGNLDAKRDWGYAPDYAEAIWLMLQQEEPDDYVVATGETHSVEEFVRAALAHAGINDWQKYVAIDPRYYRPTEVDYLQGDARKAQRKLGWKPKVKFKELVRLMLEADCERLGVSLPRIDTKKVKLKKEAPKATKVRTQARRNLVKK
jgi:GDPmannose 4,6-dehydratase